MPAAWTGSRARRRATIIRPSIDTEIPRGFEHGPEIFWPHTFMDGVARGEDHAATRRSLAQALAHFIPDFLNRPVAEGSRSVDVAL